MTDATPSMPHIPETGLTIRRLVADDASTVARLAQRDSSAVPGGMLLGAEVEGRLVAAISTRSGEVVADPFVHTAEIVDVLKLRVGQIDGRPTSRPRGGLLALLRRPARPLRTRPSVLLERRHGQPG